jgi:hypothetical protein
MRSLEQAASITSLAHALVSGIRNAKRNNTVQTDATVLVENSFSMCIYNTVYSSSHLLTSVN